MDGKNFDELVRGLGAGRSRRSVLKGLIVGGALVATGRAGSALAAKPATYDLCHVDKKGRVRQISVQGKKVQDHLDHGDTFLGSDTNCSFCGDACPSGQICSDYMCTSSGPLCNPGTMPDGTGGCVSCSPGSASSDGTACVPCAIDTYAANFGQSVCDTCPSGQGTNGATGATACSSSSGGFICTVNDTCQAACPGSAFEDFCYCSTIFETGAPVCYRSGNGCASGPYCDTNADCPGGQVCLNLNGGCGGCDNYTGGRGICNSIC